MTQRLVVLGAGTALPDRERDNTFLVWASPVGHWLIDCGGRAYQQLLRADLDPHQVRGAVLTHSHPDHIYGLPALLFHLWLCGYRDTFNVYANASTLAIARRVCQAYEWSENGNMCSTAWHAVPDAPGAAAVETDMFTLRTTPVCHSRPTFAVKIEDHEQRKHLVYSSDTAPCSALDQLAHGTHTLIHEAATNDPDQGYGHSTPWQAGEAAARCHAERLVLIHYSERYTLAHAAALADVRAAGFCGDVRIAQEFDGYALA